MLTLALVGLAITLANEIGCKQTDRILNGTFAEVGEFPFMAALYLRRPHGGHYYKCSGSIIDQRHILTAAHCLNSRSGSPLPADLFFVKLGCHKLSQCRPTYQIERHHIHPDWFYRMDPNRFDIAILRTDRSIEFNKEPGSGAIDKIRLESDHRHDYPDGQLLTIAGWGRTEHWVREHSDTLMKATVPAMSIFRCRALRRMHESVLCHNDSLSSTYHGDSGGPVIRVAPGSPLVLAGVTRGAFEGKLVLGISTRVAWYRDWIEKSVQMMDE